MNNLVEKAQNKITEAFKAGYIGQLVTFKVEENDFIIQMNHNLKENEEEFHSLEDAASTVTMSSLDELDNYFNEYFNEKTDKLSTLREYAELIASPTCPSVKLDIANDLLDKYYRSEEKYYFWNSYEKALNK